MSQAAEDKQTHESICVKLDEPCGLETPFSILGSFEKYVIITILGMSSTWSTLSMSIYFPALPDLESKFSTTTEIINMSVVVYLIVQGLSPMVLSFISDHYGRRPCLIFCLTTYCGVCVGMSRINSVWLLIFLRALQAGSISPTIAISIASVGDIAERKEKGKLVGITSGIQNISQGFGGLLGAGLVTGFGWRGIFVFLSIGSGICLIALIFLVPETNRDLVGNLSREPICLLNKAVILRVPQHQQLIRQSSAGIDRHMLIDGMAIPFKIMFTREVSLCLSAVGLQFSTWSISLTNLSQELESKYGYTVIQVGLCYLSPGVAALASSIFSGRVLDWNYKRAMARKEDKSQSDSASLLKVRLSFAGYSTAVMVLFCLIYGWCLQKKQHIAIIIVALFFMSFGIMSFMTSVYVLLTDLFPSNATALISCLNFARCLLAALFVGVLDNMIRSMGIGGCYSLMAALCLLSYFSLFAVVFLFKERG